jgi:ABC-type transporter Mla MlaB component
MSLALSGRGDEMLKIERTRDDDGRLALRLAGEISGRWVEELGRITDIALALDMTVSLDLSQVSFVDREGVALLTRLVHRDVALVKCSAFVTELLRIRS